MMTSSARDAPWWRGARGEWYVVAQGVLMALVFFGPREPGPAWLFPFPRVLPVAGAALMLAGGGLLAAALVRLGRGLTPLPYPKDGAEFAQSGAYAVVRHPMYSGGIILCVGWTLCAQCWATLAYTLALAALFDAKSRREEVWLMQRFSGYDAYRRRVRKLIPFVY
jgi:protein-S-isoprenylcysteine O-methyltransferase Ste14